MKKVSFQRCFDEMIGSSKNYYRNFIFDGHKAYFSSTIPAETDFICIGEKRWSQSSSSDGKIEKKEKNFVRLFYPAGSMKATDRPILDKSKLLHHHTGLWISHLQKSIRRQDKMLARASFLSLLALDPIKLFRRLPIIMIEDASLEPTTFLLLIWCMLACESWSPTEYELNLMLGVIDTICDLSFETQMDIQNIYDRSLLDDSPLSYSIVGLQIRQAYGGASSDMDMISRTISYMFRVLQEEEGLMVYAKESIPLVDYQKTFKYITEKEWLLAAVDYHVFPAIVKSIFREKSFISEKQIKDAIWTESSSVNKRIAKKGDICGVWKVIKSIYFSKARNLLKAETQKV